MLDSVRQNSRSAIIYILFGILIAAFIVSFGPGSPTGDSVFDGLGGRYAARVHGKDISEPELNFAFIALGLPNRGEAQAQKLREVVIDRLIERELLAHEAEQAGMLVSEDEAAKLLVDGNMFVAGIAQGRTVCDAQQRARLRSAAHGGAELVSTDDEAVCRHPAPRVARRQSFASFCGRERAPRSTKFAVSMRTKPPDEPRVCAVCTVSFRARTGCERYRYRSLGDGARSGHQEDLRRAQAALHQAGKEREAASHPHRAEKTPVTSK